MTASPKTLRNRNMTAAKRSAVLIRDAVLTHLDILEKGKVPESTFAASVARYETALTALRMLDALGEGNSTGTDTVEVPRDGLAALIELLRASDVGFAIQDAEEGSPLDSIVAVVGTGEPQEVPGD